MAGDETRRADGGPLRGVDERTAERAGERGDIGGEEKTERFFIAMPLPAFPPPAAIYLCRMLYTRSERASMRPLGVVAWSVRTENPTNQKNRNMARGLPACFSNCGRGIMNR